MWACSSKRRASRRRGRGLLVLHFLMLGFSRAAHAVPLTLPDIDLGSYFPTKSVQPFARTLGFLTQHRSYQGASAQDSEGLTGFGVRMGVEATLMGVPSGLAVPGLDTPVPLASIPILKLHADKSLGPKIDLAVSGLYYPGLLIAGGAVKYLFYTPTEGFEWALRGGVNFSTLRLDQLLGQGIPLEDGGFTIGELGMIIRAQTLNIQVVTSKKLDFAEPYIAMGVSRTQAQLGVPVTLTAVKGTQELALPSSAQIVGDATLGVAFKVPAFNFRLGLEGSYNSAQMHTLGLLIGMGL